MTNVDICREKKPPPPRKKQKHQNKTQTVGIDNILIELGVKWKTRIEINILNLYFVFQQRFKKKTHINPYKP